MRNVTLFYFNLKYDKFVLSFNCFWMFIVKSPSNSSPLSTFVISISIFFCNSSSQKLTQIDSKVSLNFHLKPSKTSLQHFTSLLNAISIPNTRWFYISPEPVSFRLFDFPQKSSLFVGQLQHVRYKWVKSFRQRLFWCPAKYSNWNFSSVVWVTVSKGVEFPISKKKKFPHEFKNWCLKTRAVNTKCKLCVLRKSWSYAPFGLARCQAFCFTPSILCNLVDPFSLLAFAKKEPNVDFGWRRMR